MIKCECGGYAKVHQGWWVCTKCGLVLEEYLSTSPEHFTHSEIMSRAPLSTTGDSTVIKGRLKPKTPSEVSKYIHLRYASQRRFKSGERHRQRISKELTTICKKLAIPSSVITDIINIYKKAIDEKVIKCNETIAKIAIIYLGCNIAKVPRFWEEIREAVTGTRETNRKEGLIIMARRASNRIREALDLPYTLETPEYYLPRLTKIVSKHPELIYDATKFINKYWKKHKAMSGHLPNIIAGATIMYLAKKRGIPISVSSLSRALFTTEVSIRKVEKEFELNNLT